MKLLTASVLLAGLPLLASSSIVRREQEWKTGLLPHKGNVPSSPRAGVMCKCMPGDSCWPSASTWASFNKTVDGRLIATVPIGSPCHDPTYDEAACAALQNDWELPETHLVSSSSVMQSYFANRSCSPFLDRSIPCTLGNYVSYAVNVSTAAHVASTIQFATQHNIRFIVRNTGHDYMGRSTGAGGLSVWMHNMKDMSMTNYANDIYNGPALQAGAGVWGTEALDFASANDHIVVTGDCPTVGLAGGFSQGGGHSILSREFGLGADQVLEYEVVTASGKITKASRSTNSDLFWAMSGGGGGTFAVATSITVRAHQSVNIGGACLETAAEYTTQEKFNEFIDRFHAAVPGMIDQGASLGWILTPNEFILMPITVYNSTGDYVKNTVMAPLNAALKELEIPAQINTSTLNYHDHYATYNGPLPYGHLLVEAYQFGSRLIPRSTIQNNTATFNKVVRNLTSEGVIVAASAGTFIAPHGVSNSVLPAWRQALIQLQLTTPWNETKWPLMLKDQKLITDVYMPQIEAITPGSGSYANEGDFHQPNWQKTFYGSNYNKLLAIKTIWDPMGVFYGLNNVGSEMWTVASNGRMCRAL